MLFGMDHDLYKHSKSAVFIAAMIAVPVMLDCCKEDSSGSISRDSLDYCELTYLFQKIVQNLSMQVKFCWECYQQKHSRCAYAEKSCQSD